MNCMQLREELRTADLSELRPGTSVLGAHLIECASCRRLAEAIVLDTEQMGALILARPSRRRTISRRALLLASLPVAAAFVVAISLKVGREEPRVARTSSRPVAREVSLTVSPGQHATVIKTPDPDVTVIWLTPGGGQ